MSQKERANSETAVKAFDKKLPDVQVITAGPSAAETVNELLKEIIKK